MKILKIMVFGGAIAIISGIALFVFVKDWGNKTKTAKRTPSSVSLQMEIKSTCTPEGALFEMINKGKKWPRKAVIGLYFANNRSLFDSRKMRMAAGQKVSFIVAQTLSRDRSLGLWIDPKWYKRKFSFDTRIRC